MLPRLILHNAVSLDGRFDGFSPDLGQFYQLASHWEEDATLVGSNTITAAEKDLLEEEPTTQEIDPNNTSPLMVIADSRGRVRRWDQWRRQPYWRDAIALCSTATPTDYLDFLKESRVDYIIAGDDHVDFRKALEELNARYGVKTVRADCGGTLNGVLLRTGLVDEVSLHIYPVLVGGTTQKSIFIAPDLTSPEGAIPLKLTHCEHLNNDTVWLLYEVNK
ncbi:RibD family protein [Chloroflexota bacterium]